MLIMKRSNNSKFLSLIRHDILMSGERILKKSDLSFIFKQKPKDYQLEIAINHYMRTNNKQVKWISQSVKNSIKLKKWGVQISLIRYAQAFLGNLIYAGPQEYIRQIIFFAHAGINND